MFWQIHQFEGWHSFISVLELCKTYCRFLIKAGYLTISVHLLKNPFLDKGASLLLHWTDWTSEAGIITPNRGVTSMSLVRESHHHGFSWPQFEREDMQITDCMWMFMIKVEFHHSKRQWAEILKKSISKYGFNIIVTTAIQCIGGVFLKSVTDFYQNQK